MLARKNAGISRAEAEECAGTRNSREDLALERGLPHPAAPDELRGFWG